MTIDSRKTNAPTSVRIALASPEDILLWSSGEVLKGDTINYRTHRPEKGGLFCERIFGPEKDWECSCGKFRGIRHKDRACPQCGVTVGPSRVRRKRMGHITLAAPVVHLWFFKNRPSTLGALLGLKLRDLKRIIYLEDQIVLDPGATGTQRGEIIDDHRADELRLQDSDFRTATGAEAIGEMLQSLDLAALADELRARMENLNPTSERHKALVRRLHIVQTLQRSPNRPEWMVLRQVPVIPPDLRPVVLLESGHYATSDLNDLYKRVIQRNNRLKKLLEMQAPRVIVRNEKRLLQQAVDSLFDNTRGTSPVLGPSKQPLKSLADLIKGKQGRFRENLLGKRVDYSGRSVIVVGPELKLHQCGLPKVMALELYQPFIVGHLLREGHARTVHQARRLAQGKTDIVWDALEAVMKGHPVLLNRAPTLHRMGIQAFEPVLVEGNALRLHPLVCKAFNADFDGDTMSVHLPLSVEAIGEAKSRLMPKDNIFGPANGQPIITPSKDMVLGCWYLTASEGSGEGRIFASMAEVIQALSDRRLTIHDRVTVRLAGAKGVIEENQVQGQQERPRRLTTSAGRVVFNDHLPAEMAFYNLAMTGKNLARIIADCQDLLGRDATVSLLETIKKVGFHEATRSGISFATDDLRAPTDKDEMIARTQAKVDRLEERYQNGDLPSREWNAMAIELWDATTTAVADGLLRELAQDRRDDQPINPIHAMLASGARGNRSQMGQLAGMRGLMRRPSGEILQTPIKASFREGLSSLEYFASTHGARKGSVDTALKTSDSGYLTRKLADVAQGVVVTLGDCETAHGIVKQARGLHSLGEMIFGRTSAETVNHPGTGRVLVTAGDLVSRAQGRLLDEAGVSSLKVRSPLTCRANRGVCQACYGLDRSTGRLVEQGTAVGIIAAQSIGEPATQLTMRTFHTGGAATAQDITLSLPRVIELFEAHKPRRPATLARVAGEVRLSQDGTQKKGRPVVTLCVKSSEGVRLVNHPLSPGRGILVKDGEQVATGQRLTEGQPVPQEILSIDGVEAVRHYLLEEIQQVYSREGIDLDDKHVEVIISRMLARVKVSEGGDTELLPGQVVEASQVRWANERVKGRLFVTDPGQSPFVRGALIERHEMESLPHEQRPVVREARQARAGRLLLGISKAALHSESFLSAASFQETTQVLAEAALAGRVDPLLGLKETVLVGGLVPAGTGFQAS